VAGAAPGHSNGVGNPGVASSTLPAAAHRSTAVTQLTTTSITYSRNHRGMLTGFAAGTGAAYAITDHIALEIEGLYYNIGTVRTGVTTSGGQTSTITGPGPTTTTTAAVTATPFTVSRMIDGFIFKGGVQYKF
jgi:opacity protein-like surface antigen